MTDPLDIGPDTGLRELWLFALHVSTDELGKWEPPRPNGPARDWPLEDALGAGPLDPAEVQIFEVDDLGKYGLRRYLTDAHGMDEAEIEADADTLDRLHGTALLVFDKALTRRPGRFAPKLPLRFIGHYRAPASLGPAAPTPPRASTRGHLEGPSGPAESPGRLNLALSVTILVLALLALAVWALA